MEATVAIYSFRMAQVIVVMSISKKNTDIDQYAPVLTGRRQDMFWTLMHELA